MILMDSLDYHDVISFEVSSMEKRSLAIYRPPADMLKKAPKAFKNENPECSVKGECINLVALKDIEQSLSELNDNIGHELVKVQFAISESVKKLDESMKPINKEITSKRNDVQKMRATLEQELQDMIDFRDRLTGSANPAEQARDLRQMTETLTGSLRNVGVSIFINLLDFFYIY